MQKEGHETEILIRLQPGFIHKTSFYEQQIGSKKPVT